MSKKIIMTLGEQSIDDAIRELRRYQEELRQKTETLQHRLGELISANAQRRFNNSEVDDTINIPPIRANVTVTVEDNGGITAVIAQGEDAVWVEFGAGVSHNGPVGQSPNPNGAGLGFTIGSFGEKGSRKVWGYYSPTGKLVKTRGTKATMPLYNAVLDVRQEIDRIAWEVFSH